MASIAAFTGTRPFAGRMAALTFSLFCQLTHAQAQAPADRAAAEIAFDLPAQPLKQALEQYDARTSVSVFFPSELTAGRTSNAVRGYFSPEQALRRMVEGTGLTVQSAAAEAFILVPESAAANVDAAAPVLSPITHPSYDGLLQSKIMQALCARADLAPGTYRLALSVLVNAAGRVAQVRLLDTTGDAARDKAIVAAVRLLDLGHAPDNPAKPFVLLVRQRPQTVAPAACPVLH